MLPSPYADQPADLLFLGGLVVTMDDEWTVIEDGAVAVTGAAGARRSARAVPRDCSGC